MRWISCVVALGYCCFAFGSQAYRPPGGGEVWQITKAFLKPYEIGSKDARGVVAFICNEAETQHHVRCYARNLQPGRAYSLWLVKRGSDGAWVKARRLSRRISPPRTNARGELRVKASQLRCPLSGYEAVGLYAEPVRGAASEGGFVLLGEIRVPR